MIKVSKVADGQQQDTEVSVTEGESEWSFSSTHRAFCRYRIRMNSPLVTDQLKTQGVSTCASPWQGRANDQTYPYRKDPFER
jgi:hypothetical protein